MQNIPAPNVAQAQIIQDKYASAEALTKELWKQVQAAEIAAAPYIKALDDVTRVWCKANDWRKSLKCAVEIIEAVGIEPKEIQ